MKTSFSWLLVGQYFEIIMQYCGRRNRSTSKQAVKKTTTGLQLLQLQLQFLPPSSAKKYSKYKVIGTPENIMLFKSIVYRLQMRL